MTRKILISLLPFILNGIVAFFTKETYYTVFIFTLVTYIFGFFLKSKKELLLAIVSYTIIAFIINVIMEGNELVRYIFQLIIYFVIAIIAGYYSKNKKFIALVFPILFISFMFFTYKNYTSMIRGINSVTIKKTPNISLFDSQMKEIDFNQKNKVYVLDFWATTCGICIKKFPDFEKTVLKYKDNPNLLFYSVNIPIQRKRETIENNIALVNKKYPYNFNKLFAKDFAVCDSLGFSKFPTLILIKNGKIHYQGSYITDKNITVHHIDTEINRVLKIKN